MLIIAVGVATLLVPLVSKGAASKPAAAAAQVGDDPAAMGGVWVEQGPKPLSNAPSVTVGPDGPLDDEASGAVEALLASPTDPDLLYAGTVSGGVWRTTDATARNPSWEPLTDHLPSLSIGALAMSPLDERILYAGTGDFSSGGSVEVGRSLGLYRSTDGGDSWEVLAGGPLARLDPNPETEDREHGMRIRNIATADDRSVLVTTEYDKVYQRHLLPDLVDELGLWHHDIDRGSWTKVSGSPGSGLPLGRVTHLVADPRDPTHQTLYAALPDQPPKNNHNSGTSITDPGVYRSVDGGATWTRIFAIPPGVGSRPIVRAEVAVSPVAGGPVFVMLVEDGSGGRLAALYVLPESGPARLVSLPYPAPIDRQGLIHGSIAADPTHTGVVYVGGRTNFFRVEVALGSGTDRFTSLTWPHSPHADSRDIVFDARGDLLQSDDGGIYRLRTAWLPGRVYWRSVNGDLAATEAYSVAYDPLNGVLVAGLQDNGVVESEPIDPASATPGSLRWWELGIDGDGLQQGAVVEEAAPPSGTRSTYRYHSDQRAVHVYKYDARNSGSKQHQTTVNNVAALAINSVEPHRVLAVQRAGDNNMPPAELLESHDRFQSIPNVQPTAWQEVTAILYGGRRQGTANADLVYAGVKGQGLWVRTGPHDTSLPDNGFERVQEYLGGTPQDIAVDAEDHGRLFVLDRNHHIWARSADGAFVDLTGDLDAVGGGYVAAETIAFLDLGDSEVLLVGGMLGVYGTYLEDCAEAGSCTWQRFGTGLPAVKAMDLVFVPEADLLVLGTFGRGVWTMPRVSEHLRPGPAPALVQGRFGTPGNLELAYPAVGAGIGHEYLSPGGAEGWLPSYEFGQGLGPIDALAMIQSSFGDPGNLEIVARAEDRLFTLWRDSGPQFLWNGPDPIRVDGEPVTDARGNVGFVQSSFGTVGNFEVVYPSTSGGFVHLYRDNDAGGDHPPWIRTGAVGDELGIIDGLTMIQSSYTTDGAEDGNLEVIARVGSELHHLWRGADLEWVYAGLVADDAGGDPSLVQRTVVADGAVGDFELVYPAVGEGFVHLRRDNRVEGDEPPWIRSGPHATDLGPIDGLSLAESAATAPGDAGERLELVVRVDNGLHHLWRGDGPAWQREATSPRSTGLPSVSISQDQEVQEEQSGARRVEFTVTLSRRHPEQVVVGYTTRDGSARAPGDYRPKSGTLRFEPGRRSRTVTVYVRGDAVDEPLTETFFVDLAPGPYLRSRETAQVTIVDDTPTISIGDTVVDEPPSGSRPAEFVVALDHPSTAWVTVSYATEDLDADAGTDYRPERGTVRFRPGELEHTVSVRVRGDTRQEDDESFSVVLSRPNRGVLATDDRGQATILDDNARITTFDEVVAEPDSGSSPVRVEVALERPSEQWIRVPYRTVSSGLPGSATPNVDYWSRTGTVRFAPGEVRRYVTIWVRSDEVTEPDEEFQVELTKPANGRLIVSTAVVTIQD